MEQGTRKVRSWEAMLLAAAPALLATVVIETLRVTLTSSGSLLSRVLGTYAEVSESGFKQLSLPLLFVLGQALALWIASRPRRRLAGMLAFGCFSGLQIFLVRAEAFEAPYLARNWNIGFAFLLCTVMYVAVALWLCLPGRAPRFRRVSGALLALASLAAAVVHYRFYVGLYPTLHTAIAMLGFLGVHLGTSMLLAGWRASRRLRGSLIAIPALLLVAGALTPAPTRERGRSYVAAQSALVRPVVIDSTPAELMLPDGPVKRQAIGPMRPDLEAVARFAEKSGLPPLPQDFDLAEHDVLMVFIDALRYDRTSLASAELGTTPWLAGFVERGAYSFTRAYSPSNGTFPSMASILSMTTPSFSRMEIHAKHWHGRLRPEQRTAPEALREVGFRTFWVGHDFKRVMTIRVHGIDQGFDSHHLELIWPGRDLDADARIASKAIREIRAARASGKRYFGVVFFCSPHDDYQIHFPRLPAETERDRYDQEIRYADLQLRRVMEEVARGGGLKRTVVIISGDHGEAFSEHRHRFHLSSLYSEQVRVPLVVSVPGMEGEAVSTPTSNLYVLPWLLLRGPPPARSAAESVLREDLGPLLRETRGAVISEFISRQRQHATLRYDDYTIYYDLMADYFGVFDAREDALEQRDLREERPDLVERFTPLTQGFRRARFAGQRYFFRLPDE